MKATTLEHDHTCGAGFDAAAEAVRHHFNTHLANGTPLFTTKPRGDVDLFAVYLNALPEEERQHHTCDCCKQFIRKFGSLVTIDERGEAHPVMWPAPEGQHGIYGDVFFEMRFALRKVNVTGVFLSDEKEWGRAEAGGFSHFSVTPSRSRVATGYKRPHEVAAQKKQDFGTLSHGLAEYEIETVADALNLLESDSLYRSEKVRGPAKFLHDLHLLIADNRPRKNNLIWRAVALAPVGFATPRSSMVGTLLDDLKAGKPLEDVKRSFAAKMGPLQYQRPQAAPSAGNIARAEKLVEEMGIANSLKRRFARLDDMQLIWEPTPASTQAGDSGVFADLAREAVGKRTREIVAKGGDITWSKFASTVLPKALRIQALMSHRAASFCGVLTAVDPDAPPILQWDRLEARNPISWYLYHRGSFPENWGLRTGELVEVNGISLKPSMWNEVISSNYEPGALLILEGAKDQNKMGELGLFPEILKSELHEVRSTIEAFSKRRQPEGADEASANGLLVAKNGCGAIIRVTTALGLTDYLIDRWD